ncbi:gastric inhibitory polypeptide [Ornithorhynchus anatinus]|uniref:gastric inhibitory polypeptide n=1 Tax=Ornithorhynchus anatinus TaxID=9258 RepID=UPI0010A8DFEF|nr:gastric inhibitory polypeptide [Ornithorhynchus anatinus]
MVPGKVFPLLLVSLGLALADLEENDRSSPPLAKRYSEGTFINDYSRALSSLQEKKFVDWLLKQKERKKDYIGTRSGRDLQTRQDAERGGLGGTAGNPGNPGNRQRSLPVPDMEVLIAGWTDDLLELLVNYDLLRT